MRRTRPRRTCVCCARGVCWSPYLIYPVRCSRSILQGIEETAHAEGYAVLLGDTQYDQGREERYAQMLQAKEADGLIFLGRKLSKGVEGIVKGNAARRAPVVNALGFVPQLGIPSVQIDNRAAAVEAMEHLYRLGHRHIGLVTGPALSYVSDQRLRGARERARRSRRSGTWSS